MAALVVATSVVCSALLLVLLLLAVLVLLSMSVMMPLSLLRLVPLVMTTKIMAIMKTDDDNGKTKSQLAGITKTMPMITWQRLKLPKQIFQPSALACAKPSSRSSTTWRRSMQTLPSQKPL